MRKNNNHLLAHNDVEMKGIMKERKRIAKLLKPFEWSGNHTDYEDSWAVLTRACPFCFNARKDGHKKNCLFVSLQEG